MMFQNGNAANMPMQAASAGTTGKRCLHCKITTTTAVAKAVQRDTMSTYDISEEVTFSSLLARRGSSSQRVAFMSVKIAFNL